MGLHVLGALMKLCGEDGFMYEVKEVLEDLLLRMEQLGLYI